jgi:uncharacterized protein (DUF3820 family)
MSAEILDFGKYKNRMIGDVFSEDKNYCQWLYNSPMTKTNENIFNFLETKFKDKNDIYLTFGKYKNKSLSWILEHDKKYIMYLKSNEFVKEKLTKLYEAVNKLNI